jgi:hypothetical protein
LAKTDTTSATNAADPENAFNLLAAPVVLCLDAAVSKESVPECVEDVMTEAVGVGPAADLAATDVLELSSLDCSDFPVALLTTQASTSSLCFSK